MKVSTIVMSRVLTGTYVLRDMKVNEGLAQYFVRKFEDHAAEVSRLNEQLDELKSRLQLVSQLSDAAASLHVEAEKQVQALAAENAELRKWANVVGFDKDTEASANMEYGGFINALNCIKSDNTDAILNEVRAQAIEGFADDWQKLTQYSRITEMARDYANKLRAGEVQP